MEPLRTNRARGQSPTHKGLPDKHSHTALVAHTRVGDRALLLRRIGLTIGIIVCAQALYLLDLEDTPNTNPSDDRVGLSSNESNELTRRATERTTISPRPDTMVVSSTSNTTLPVPTTSTPTFHAPGTTDFSTSIRADSIITAPKIDPATPAQRVSDPASNADTTDYNAPWELPVYTNGKQTSKVRMHPRVNFCVGLHKDSPEIAGGTTLSDISLGCFQSSTAVRPPGIPGSLPVAETAAACTAACSKAKFAFAGLTTEAMPSCVCANELGARADFEPPDHTEWRNASVAGELERCRKVPGGDTIAFFRIGIWPTPGALGDIALPSPDQPRPVITVFLWANPRLAAIFRTCRLSRMSTEYDYDVFDLRHQVWSILFMFFDARSTLNRSVLIRLHVKASPMMFACVAQLSEIRICIVYLSDSFHITCFSTRFAIQTKYMLQPFSKDSLGRK